MIVVVLCGGMGTRVHSVYDPPLGVLCIHCGRLCVDHAMMEFVEEPEEQSEAVSEGSYE